MPSKVIRAAVRQVVVLLCAVALHAEAASISFTGHVLNPAGGADATRAPMPIPHFAHDHADIRLDGKLEESVWSRVPAYDHMTIVQPDVMQRPPYRTHTFLFYTEKGLYVGAWNQQPPETMISRLSGRDQFDKTDVYQIMVDASGNGLYGYWYMVKLGSTLNDGTLMPERRFSNTWDGPWRAATDKVEDGWTVEIFIPWAIMNMPDQVDGMRKIGIHVTRDLGRKSERWSWPALPDTKPRYLSAFQPILLEGVAPRQEVSLFPYMTYGRDMDRGVNDWKVGMDVFWRPSSSFLISGAVNPDFGQVEADKVVVNLSAFETFFPEKRLFFLENQDVFVTSGSEWTSSTSPVHTRRIGSSVGSRQGAPDFVDGQEFDGFDTEKPVDLLLAAKTVKQIGRSRLGVLAAAEDDTDLGLADGSGSVTAPGRDIGILRWQHENTDGGGRRALGWLTTFADHPERRAVAHVVDGHYLSASGAWNTHAQLLHSDVEDAKSDQRNTGLGAILDALYIPRQGDQHTFHLETYDDDIDLNDLGFLSRNGYTSTLYEFSRRRSGYESIKSTNGWAFFRGDVNRDGRFIGGGVMIHQGWTFNDNTGLGFDLHYDPAAWDDRNSRGNGSFKLDERWGINAGWNSASDGVLAGNINLGVWSESLGGRSFSGHSFLSYRPIDRIRARIGIGYSRRDSWLLWQGGTSFTTYESEEWSPSVGIETFFTARQHLRIELQWVGIKAVERRRYVVPAGDGPLQLSTRPPDTPASRFAISDLVLQVRYRWQIAPMSDLFVVYNRGGDIPGASPELQFSELFTDAWSMPQREGLIVKLRYRFGI